MSKITKVQKYAALWLHHSSWSVENIAKELELTDKQIQTIVSTVDNTDKIKTKSRPATTPASKDLMIRETANKNSHVAIMTKESSMINDEVKKNMQQKSIKDIPGIYRPNGN